LLGFGLAANYTVGSVAAGLAVTVFVLGESFRSRVRGVIAIVVPAAAVVLAIYAGILRLMTRDAFVAGLPLLRDSLMNLTYGSIRATPRIGVFGARSVASVLAFGVLPAIILFITTVSLFAWREGKRQELVPAMALGAAGAGLMGAHYLLGTNYPIDRTGLTLMVLFGIVWALAAGNTSNRVLRAINLVLGALLAIQFATQFHTSYFQIWWYDRSTKAIAKIVEQEIGGRPPGSISIGATWIHQPALEYYRLHDRVAALKPVQRREVTLVTGQDYYVLNQQDKNFAAARDRTVLFSDPFAGVVLAK
jgi:hypothetical protein